MSYSLSLPEGKHWLFVAGIDRGGTTITTQVLNTHPEIAVDIERAIVGRYEYLVAQIRRNQIELPHQGVFPAIREDLETIAPIWERQLLAGIYEYYGRRPQRYVGDKIPWYTGRLNYLRETYPGARFLLNWREPLGTIASWKAMPWRRHLTLPDMVETYNELVDHLRREQNHADALILRHDQLLTSPEEVFRQVAAFLQLPATFDTSLVQPLAAKTLTESECDYVLTHARSTL